MKRLSNILFVGDIHGEMYSYVKSLQTAARKGIEHVVFVGDFWLYSDRELKKIQRVHDNVHTTLGVRVTSHFIDGNHEDFTRINPHAKEQDELIEGTLIYHPRGNVFEIDGVSILAFGGARSHDIAYRDVSDNSKEWSKEEYPTDEDFLYALERAREHNIDVLVTHDTVPEVVGKLIDKDIPFTANRLTLKQIEMLEKLPADEALLRERIQILLEESSARYMFHGHHHRDAVTQCGNQTVVSLGCNTQDAAMAYVDGDKIYYNSGKEFEESSRSQEDS